MVASGVISFAAAVFFMLITPGPGVLSTAGIGSGFGFRAGMPYLTGLVVGAQIVGLAVATGLAAAVFAVPYVREVLLIASAAYLVYLAIRIAASGSKVAFVAATRAPGFMNGVALQAINPKAYAVNTTLFSGFAFWPDSIVVECAIKFVIIVVLSFPIHMVWLYAGAKLKQMALSAWMNRLINILMAIAMLAVVAMAFLF